jgi:secreted trypsin-like serine protease
MTLIGGQPLIAREQNNSNISANINIYDSFGFNGYCGLTLIYFDFIMTAAHCASDFIKSPYIFIGSNRLYDHAKNKHGMIKIDTTRMFIHPQYNSTTYANDIMLIQLTCRARQSDIPLQKINFNDAIPTVDGNVQAIGFGVTDTNSNAASEVLSSIDINIINGTLCHFIYQLDDSIVDFVQRTICAGVLYYGGKDSCRGDSGGPLYDSSGTQVGIVSVGYGYNCGQPMYPGLYTRVSNYKYWIQQTIVNNTNRTAPYCKNNTT